MQIPAFKTGSIHFMQIPATLVQLAEKPLPHQRKILNWIYPFHANSSNFGSAGRKAPPTPREKIKTGSIHFMQIPAILVQLVEKPPPRKKF